MKKNIIASILQSIGTIIVVTAIRFEISSSWYVWWINLIITVVMFIGYMLFNTGIERFFKK